MVDLYQKWLKNLIKEVNSLYYIYIFLELSHAYSHLFYIGFLNVVARAQFNDEWQHDKVTGLWVEEFSLFRRVCCASEICIFVSIWLSFCLVAVIFILLLRDQNPKDLMLKILLGVANAVMIFVFNAIYKVVWHRTEQDFQKDMIYKSFCFKFVNSFALIYYYVHLYDTVCGSVALLWVNVVIIMNCLLILRILI